MGGGSVYCKYMRNKPESEFLTSEEEYTLVNV